jgi:hypothetical protein
MGQKFEHRLHPMQYQISGMDKSSSKSPNLALYTSSIGRNLLVEAFTGQAELQVPQV